MLKKVISSALIFPYNIIRMVHAAIMRLIIVLLGMGLAYSFIARGRAPLNSKEFFYTLAVSILVSLFWGYLHISTEPPIIFKPMYGWQKSNSIKKRIGGLVVLFLIAGSLKRTYLIPSSNSSVMAHLTVYLVYYIFYGSLLTTIIIALKKPVKPSHSRKPSFKSESTEEAIKRAGEEGEKEVAYALEWLDKSKFTVFKNLRLRCENVSNESQEFDHIVVGENGIFNIETKNYGGRIRIDSDGNWTRERNGREEGLKNPLAQATRHHKVLQGILGTRLPIIDVIALANEKCIIEGAKNSPISVVKSDSLQYFIENYNSGVMIPYIDRKSVVDLINYHRIENITDLEGSGMNERN